MPIILTPNPDAPDAATPSNKRIKVTRRDGAGGYLDFDSLPILRDPTLTYGVIRADGGVVLAADGVNNVFTRDDEGQYHFVISNLTPGVTYTAWVEQVGDGQTERNSITWTAGTAQAVGYYAQRDRVAQIAGQEQYDAEMRLDPFALVADEDVVQSILNNADNMVDAIAYEEGVAQAGTVPHFIATDDAPVFEFLQFFASRWARADGHLLRGELSDVDEDIPGGAPNTSPEGIFRKMKTEAEKRIRNILSAKAGRERVIGTGMHGMAVGYQPHVRPSCGIDGIVKG